MDYNNRASDSEKATDDNVVPPYELQQYHFSEHDLDRVQRRLKQRHIQMIAIAGTIGTGLFLGSGNALSTAGPLGALIAYVLVGSVGYSTLCSLGEMTTWAPISGTFPHFAARWIDPAYGFALGWNYFYSSSISIPSEITASVLVLSFWDANQNHVAAYTAVVCVVVCGINILGVRYFGEAEFIFCIIKITLIIGLLFAGLIIDLGGSPSHDRIGFRYWKNPGPLNRAGLVSNIHTDRFLAILSVIVQAAYSYQGMEIVCIGASETENPRRNIKKAVGRVFYRIVLFYVLGVIVIGMLVPYNNSLLLQATGNAAQSPFVIAINTAGIKVLPHIINACVFTSALSAGNSAVFASARVLYGLALRGQAPRIFTRCTEKGLPLAAVVASGAFAFLSFMNVSKGGETVFNWFVSIVTTSGFVGWFSINLTFLRFRRGMIAQGFDLRTNVYHNRFQPFVAFWGMFWCLFFTLVNGYAVFFDFNVSNFVASYVNIPIFLVFFLGYKIARRTKFWRSHEMDFVTGIPTPEETESSTEQPRSLAEKISDALF